MAEDRGIEPYEQLARLADSEGIYAELIRLVPQGRRQVQLRPVRLSPRATRSRPSLALTTRCSSPSSRPVLPAIALRVQRAAGRDPGQRLRAVLGKVIRLTAAHQAKVEEKPEVRKAGGVYYTPPTSWITSSRIRWASWSRAKARKQLAAASDVAGYGLRLRLVPVGRVPIPARLLLALVRRRTTPEKHPNAVMARLSADPTRWRGMAADHRREKAHPTTHIFGVDIDRAGGGSDQAVAAAQGAGRRKRRDIAAAAPVPGTRPAQSGQQHQVRQQPDRAGLLPGQLLPDAEELRRVNPSSIGRAEFPDAMEAGEFDSVSEIRLACANPDSWLPGETEASYRRRPMPANRRATSYIVRVRFIEQCGRHA